MPLECFLKVSLLVLFTLHTLPDLWKGSDSFLNKWMQRLQQKLSVLFLFKRLMIDSVQYSPQVWSIYQAVWRWKAKESGTHRISVVHYNRRSLSLSPPPLLPDINQLYFSSPYLALNWEKNTYCMMNSPVWS